MARYREMFQIEVNHSGLNKYRIIRGSDMYVVEQKARMLNAQWDEEWFRKLEKEQQFLNRQQLAEKNLRGKEQIFQAKEELRLAAEQSAQEAKSTILQLQQTLVFTLSIDDTIDWNTLKDNRLFSGPKPKKTNPPFFAPLHLPREPMHYDNEFKAKLNWLCHLFKSKKDFRIREAHKRYVQVHQSWCVAKREIEAKNVQMKGRHDQELKRLEFEFQQAMADYEQAKSIFKEEQRHNNLLIDQKKSLYMSGDTGAVIDYCEMVLANSIYPDTFPKNFDLDYNGDTKILIVEYQLPALHNLPSTKDVRYLKSKDEIQEINLSEKELVKLYDDLIYQIILRSLHELFEADAANTLDAIIFNGIVTSVDKAHGNVTSACIVSIQASKDEFMAINLAQVDPKACFKLLKGVGSSQLHSLTPIPPILQIDKSDRRFVNGYDVAGTMDDSTNLAAMNWEDFEHLIRELFEKEFRQNGGECRVTRASRDGGVDAIAFDPDPIRGGKIVIQAKRYTKTVGVSAVRDLYGTVLNEGATKGILVTTADYGPDSYDFARGKPLTLLNGANLLHLLETHGHRAKIDLQAARISLALESGRVV